MGWVCSCGDAELPDEACKVHGLADGQKWPPMDRHARPGEDAAAAQRRLYAEARGEVDTEPRKSP